MYIAIKTGDFFSNITKPGYSKPSEMSSFFNDRYKYSLTSNTIHKSFVKISYLFCSICKSEWSHKVEKQRKEQRAGLMEYYETIRPRNVINSPWIRTSQELTYTVYTNGVFATNAANIKLRIFRVKLINLQNLYTENEMN